MIAIGETRTIEITAVETGEETCDGCIFYTPKEGSELSCENRLEECTSNRRPDKKNVIFKRKNDDN